MTASTAQPPTIPRWLHATAAAIVHTHLFVSAALGSLVLFAQRAIERPLEWTPALFCAAGVLAIYNFDDLIDPAPQRRAALPGQWPNRLGLGLGLLGAALWFPSSTFANQPWLYGAAALGLSYAVPWRPSGGPGSVRRLKDIPGTKAWLVATVITATAWGLALGQHGSLRWNPALAVLFVLVATNVGRSVSAIMNIKTLLGGCHFSHPLNAIVDIVMRLALYSK